ncbi:MAG: DUF4129 domain-containing protein [Herpetosiphon sp.]
MFSIFHYQIMLNNRSALLVLTLTLILLMARPVNADENVSLNDYDHLVRQAYSAAQHHDRMGLAQVADRLISIQHVRLDNGESIPVDNHWLAAELAGEAGEFQTITVRLGALLDALNHPMHQQPQALSTLQRIVSKPPFIDREIPHGIHASWNAFWSAVGRGIERIGRWIVARLPRLPTARVNDHPGVPSFWSHMGFAGMLLFTIAVSFVAGTAFYTIWKRGGMSFPRRIRKAKRPTIDMTTSIVPEVEETRPRSGDYRAAVRALYLRALVWLAVHGSLQFEASQTNRELVNNVGGAILQSRLIPVVDAFDRIWYGCQDPSEDEFIAFEALIGALKQGPDG